MVTRNDTGIYGVYSTVASSKTTAGVVTLQATAAAKLIANIAELRSLINGNPSGIPDGDFVAQSYKNKILAEIDAMNTATVGTFD